MTSPNSEQPGHWFEAMADHLGPAYLRYSFTKGTENEVTFLIDALGLVEGQRVLDVGCGPGRHAHALAKRGMDVVGIDISQRFIDLAKAEATDGATFIRMDAREMDWDQEFDAAISLCQGAFGLLAGRGGDDDDGLVIDRMATALRPGGRLAVSAFSAYFQVRWLEETDDFDASSGVNHEVTMLRDGDGNEAPFDLWTSCFTPRELRLIASQAGLEVVDIWSVTPGDYRREPPNIGTPELLLLAERPGGTMQGASPQG